MLIMPYQHAFLHLAIYSVGNNIGKIRNSLFTNWVLSNSRLNKRY